MKKDETFGVIFIIAILLAIALFSITGYIMNITQFIAMDGSEFSMLAAARLIGIVVAPVGIILGYF